MKTDRQGEDGRAETVVEGSGREIRIPRPPSADGVRSWLSIGYDPAPDSPVCLIFVHGFGSSRQGTKASSFRQRAQESGLAFCGFDFQGHGNSGGSLRELTPRRNLDDLGAVIEFLRSVGHDRFVLIGSSMGAATAMWFAAARPEGIVASIQVAPALELAAGFERRLGTEAVACWQRDGELAIATDRGEATLGWEFLVGLRDLDPGRLVLDYRVPTLIFQGMRDDTVSWSAVAELVGRLPAPCELVLFSEGDHRLNDRRELLWTRSLEFLQTRGLAS